MHVWEEKTDEGSVLQELLVIVTVWCCNMANSEYFVKSPPRALILCRHVTNILKMCMKKFNEEKIFLIIYSILKFVNSRPLHILINGL